MARAAAADGRFPTVDSLRGRQLAVASQGSSAEFGMLRVLGQAGLGRDDVQLTVLNFPDVNGALVNGALDAAWQAEPFVTLGVRQGQIHRLIGSEDPTGVVHSASVIVYGEEFMARKPEAADRFMVGYLRGVRDSYEAFFGSGQGREAVVAALIKYTPVKDPTLYEDMAVQHQDPNGYVPLEGLRQIAEWSGATGYTQQPVDVAGLVDHRYVEKALARLGHYAWPRAGERAARSLKLIGRRTPTLTAGAIEQLDQGEGATMKITTGLRWRRQAWGAGATLFAALVMAFACAPAAPPNAARTTAAPEPGAGGVLTMAFPSTESGDANTFDPQNTGGTYVNSILPALYDTLVYQDPATARSSPAWPRRGKCPRMA